MKAATQTNLKKFLNVHNLGAINSLQSVSGGSINSAFQLETSAGTFFLKVNSASQFPQMFETELKGLKLLAQSQFHVPKPIGISVIEDNQFILMEWIEKGVPQPGFWDEFGKSLAELHSISNQRFGLYHDNYIGSLPQGNSEHETWAELYREERLLPQMKLAERQGRLTSKMKSGFDGLFQQLDNIFPKEEPSLIHGDLWSGNMMVTSNGSPSIFDPAVYFGHREMDLGMMALFGGFGDAWVSAYNEMYPLESDWHERIPIGQLYPLMVHVNLFGGGYGSDVESVLRKFV